MTPEQLRESAKRIRLHNKGIADWWEAVEIIDAHAAALEEIERLKGELTAMTTERNSYKINASVYKGDSENAEAALAAQSVKLKADEIAWHEQEEEIRDLLAERDALKRHAEAMATTLDDWSRIDQCPCVALDNYRAEFKGE